MKIPYWAIVVLLGFTVSIYSLTSEKDEFTSFQFDTTWIPGFETADAKKPLIHMIELHAVQLMPKDMHSDVPILAYKMESYEIIHDKVDDDEKKKNKVLTDNYPDIPTIPGPTIVINEGDFVHITLKNKLMAGHESCVSVHVHGIHYGIGSDGTLKMINGDKDSCATPDKDATYEWQAGKGTAGTWPYHDHTLGTGDGGHGNHESSMITPTQGNDHEFGTSMHGSSSKGLFGTLIINSKDKKVDALVDGVEKNIPLKKIEKEIVLYMIGTRFYGNEIDNSNGMHKALWENPMLVAKLNDYVRFHVISLGTDSGAFHKMAGGINAMPMEHLPEEFHTFHIHGHRWLDQGTSTILDTKTVGPAESTQFVIKAGGSVGMGSWMYHCHVLHHMTQGMWHVFKVTGQGGPSVAGDGWEEMMHHMPHSGNT